MFFYILRYELWRRAEGARAGQRQGPLGNNELTLLIVVVMQL